MSGSPSTSHRVALPQGGTAALELPADLVSMLEKEAKVRRKTIAKVVREWLEDQADARDATRIMKRIEEGKERLIPAEEVYKKLGI